MKRHWLTQAGEGWSAGVGDSRGHRDSQGSNSTVRTDTHDMERPVILWKAVVGIGLILGASFFGCCPSDPADFVRDEAKIFDSESSMGERTTAFARSYARSVKDSFYFLANLATGDAVEFLFCDLPKACKSQSSEPRKEENHEKMGTVTPHPACGGVYCATL